MTHRPIDIALSAPVAPLAESHPGARVASLPLAGFDPPPPKESDSPGDGPKAASATTRTVTSLARLGPGGRMIVRRIDTEPGFARRLMELGLIAGTEAEVIRRAPFGDPIEVRVRGTHFSIRRSEAERIHGEAL